MTEQVGDAASHHEQVVGMDASGTAGFGVEKGDAAGSGGGDGAAGFDDGVAPNDGGAEGFGGGVAAGVGGFEADHGRHGEADAAAVEVEVEIGEGEEGLVKGPGEAFGGRAVRAAGEGAGEVTAVGGMRAADGAMGGVVDDGHGE